MLGKRWSKKLAVEHPQIDMANLLKRLADKGFVRLYRGSVVGDFDGITLVSLCPNPDAFVQCIRASLKLIRDYDPRRYKRVVKQTRWLVDSTLSGGSYSGEYQHRIKATGIDFELDESVGDQHFHEAYYASLVIHEATHGVIRDRNIDTEPGNRIQVERICTAESNRFIGLLQRSIPTLSDELVRPFNPVNWAESWNSGPLRRALKELRRINQKFRNKIPRR